ncbi:MAG: T9SS type A sorting domain-containing protein, partial [Ignavibacteriaceae bacterium]
SNKLLPKEYNLYDNYPNPFNPTTIIKYDIPKNGLVTLKVYDILGSEVVTLVNEEKTVGRYEVLFDASSLASGVYIYHLKAEKYISAKKMILLK